MSLDTHTLADTITVASGTLSAGVKVDNQHIVGLVIPTSNTWATAVITLQASLDGANWIDLYDTNGNALTLQAAAGRYIVLPPAMVPAVAWVRARSGTAATPVTQTVQVGLSWIVRPYG
jgi:hypothetical protein